ncbi:hypothetical protein ACLOJK_010310 [Asimina triloba]
MSIVHQQWPRRRIAFFSCSRRNSRIRAAAASTCSFSSATASIPPFSDASSTAGWHRPRKVRIAACSRSSRARGEGSNDDENDLERALRMDGTIPGSSDEFVKRVSSRAYGMRRHLEQSIDSSSYDVLDANPWRDSTKPVYVLTQRENQLCTMKTRRNRRFVSLLYPSYLWAKLANGLLPSYSEVERELGMLFSKGRKLRSEIGNEAKPKTSTKFRMLVEDVREGVLPGNVETLREVASTEALVQMSPLRGISHYQVFEDEQDAVRYCDLLAGGGQGCEGIAELEASSVFDICHKMRGLAVLFRRGRTPPLPESLKQNLRARKLSLEDQEDAMRWLWQAIQVVMPTNVTEHMCPLTYWTVVDKGLFLKQNSLDTAMPSSAIRFIRPTRWSTTVAIKPKNDQGAGIGTRPWLLSARDHGPPLSRPSVAYNRSWLEKFASSELTLGTMPSGSRSPGPCSELLGSPFGS